MKLHTDGTIEGTPEEVAAYKREIYPLLVSEGASNKVTRRIFTRQPYPLPALRHVELTYEPETELEKPPLGLMPRWIWDAARLQEVEAAIERFKDAGKEIPILFEDEQWELQEELKRQGHPAN